MKKIIFTLLIALLAMPVVQAQGEMNWWYFGNGIGLNFNKMTTINNEKVPLSVTGPIATNEGSSVLSDKDGNLQFSTDGRKVYNKKNEVMENGTDLYGHYSTAQTIISPWPEDPTKFFIITIGADGDPIGINYTIVDMSANNGLGKVVNETKNSPLRRLPSFEDIAVLPHDNGKDYWVVNFSINSMYVWLVTKDGFSQPKNYYVTNLPLYSAGRNGAILKFSIDNTKFVFTTSLCDALVSGKFDTSTGVISNIKSFFLGWTTDPEQIAYGVSFSPSGEYVYVSTITGNGNPNNLFVTKFADLQRSVNTFKALATKLQYNVPSTLQLGPDRKIYGTDKYTKLIVIKNPDEGGDNILTFPNYWTSYGAQGLWSLPTFSNTYFTVPPAPKSVCQSSTRSTYKFDLPKGVTGITSLEWNFGDGSKVVTQTVSGTATTYSQSHPYTTNGDYIIKVTPITGATRLAAVRTTKATVKDCDIMTNPVIRQDLSTK